MNREIEFRGFNKKNNKWLYGDLIHDIGVTFIAPLGIADPLATAEDFEVDPDTVGQYTGLKDKNGVKIYEDDIVNRDYVDRTMSHVYKWIDKYACFAGEENVKYGDYMYFQKCDEHKLEVVGNIHDNPELLNKE